MRYFVSVGQNDHSIEVTRRGDGVMAHDGVQERTAAVQGAKGCYRVCLGDRVFDLLLRNVGATDERGRIPLEVQHRGRIQTVHISSARDVRTQSTKAHNQGSSRTLRAQMAGKVLQVKVAAGARALAGDPLLVLEAMKMENELYADADLVILEVLVNPGDTVEAGAALLVVC